MSQRPTSGVGGSSKTAQAVPKETLEKLAERLKEIVGGDFELPKEQLINEEGLPIIEFTENISEPYQPTKRVSSPPPLKPLPKTDAERQARRREIEDFFAALEEEERLEEEKTEENEFLRLMQEAKERAEETRTGENTKLNAATQAVATTLVDRPEESNSDSELEPGRLQEAVPKPKKSVSFAETAESKSQYSKWGDVQQGRLRNLTGIRSGGDIMKLNIVERFPSTEHSGLDSDDEDELEETSDSHSIEADSEEGGVGVDEAMHHREIALRYHALRQSLGAGPRAGPLGGPVDPEEYNDWDQEDVPLEASLHDPNGRKDRLKFNSTRLSEQALQAQLPSGLASEIHQGTFDGDEAVAEVDEADDFDIGPRGRRIIEGLKRGLTVEEVMANEPDDEDEDEAEPKQPTTQAEPVKAGSAVMGRVIESNERVIKPSIVSSDKPVKVSRFKATRMG